MDARFKSDEVGASAYDPRVMLKVLLLAYSCGLMSSRTIERACARNVQFIAISGESQPSHTHIAKFVSALGAQIKPLFSQVLMTCDARGLIGREMFAIDGVKLPSNASKERRGTHEELRHRARRLEKAADQIVDLHQSQDRRSTHGGTSNAWCTTPRSWPITGGGSKGNHRAQERPETRHQGHNGGVRHLRTSILATPTTLAPKGVAGHGRRSEIGVYLQPR